MLGEQSTVRRVQVDDFLEKNPDVPRPRGSPHLLLESVRNLRVTALRCAVDPVYAALLTTADASSFSPLHPLVFLAQFLEEAGSYPYWQTLPPPRDVVEPFICSEKDPEFASATAVLRCFEGRYPGSRTR